MFLYYIWLIDMYDCEEWVDIKRWRLDAFEMWCYRLMFRISWTQNIKKDIVPQRVHMIASRQQKHNYSASINNDG